MKILVVLTLCLLILAGCTTQPGDLDIAEEHDTFLETPDNNLEVNDITIIMEVSVFGIGRADAILITTANHTVLIDTGERHHGHLITNHLLRHGLRQIDYLIITHFDRDHVGGAYVLINALGVQNVIVPNYSRESNHINRFETAMRNNGIEAFVLTETLRFTLDGVEFIMNPSQLEYFHFARIFDEDNGYEDGDEPGETPTPTGDDFSIIVSVTHGENSFLFTGDATANRLQEFLENDELMIIEYDFVKMPRHGRHNSRIAEFVSATNPRYAIITGFHPSYLPRYYPERPTDERVIAALDYTGAQIFFTMSTGVHVRSDGVELVLIYRNFFAE